MYKKSDRSKKAFCLTETILFKNYFTNSLKFLPAEKAGTVLAAIFNSLPVCGFLPVLAALLRASQVPKPTKVTYLPLATVFWIISKVADKTSEDTF